MKAQCSQQNQINCPVIIYVKSTINEKMYSPCQIHRVLLHVRE